MKNTLTKTNSFAMALGFFDGVHRGHGALLEKVREVAEKSAVLTFNQHPGTVLGREKVPLITSVEDRKWLFTHLYGISQVIVEDFEKICSMEWEMFIDEFLVKKWNVSHVVAGHDFHFGQGGKGNPEKLKEKCEELGIHCTIIPAVVENNVVISSTVIRNLLESGEVGKALAFSGHPHILSNQVQHGNKIGKNTLGFPTVNLAIPHQVLIPKFGVYACKVWVEDEVFQAVTNVGIRPTVTEETDKSVSVEGFLLDFPDRDLYGEELRMEFYDYLREEQKFDSFSQLSEQIAKDVENTRDFFMGKGKEII